LSNIILARAYKQFTYYDIPCTSISFNVIISQADLASNTCD